MRGAYHLLGVPPSSSALEIKRAFRRLAKTWHPDKWQQGTPQQAKAAERMREINGAFQAVRHAPLRYHIEGHPRVSSRAADAGREVSRPTIPVTDRLEWAVRFGLGALFGVFVNVVLMCGGTVLPTIAWIGVPALAGLASASFGDAFWGWALESLWWLDLLS